MPSHYGVGDVVCVYIYIYVTEFNSVEVQRNINQVYETLKKWSAGSNT